MLQPVVFLTRVSDAQWEVRAADGSPELLTAVSALDALEFAQRAHRGSLVAVRGSTASLVASAGHQPEFVVTSPRQTVSIRRKTHRWTFRKPRAF